MHFYVQGSVDVVYGQRRIVKFLVDVMLLKVRLALVNIVYKIRVFILNT